MLIGLLFSSVPKRWFAKEAKEIDSQIKSLDVSDFPRRSNDLTKRVYSYDSRGYLQRALGLGP